MSVTKAVKIAFLGTVMTIFGSSAFANSEEILIRGSDKLHFDVRQIQNRDNQAEEVRFSMSLCVAPKTSDGGAPTKAVCQSIDESRWLAVAAKPADKTFSIVQFKEEAQSQRRQGPEINLKAKNLLQNLAQEIRSPRALTVQDVTFRLSLEMTKKMSNGAIKLDTQYADFPPLTEEAPASERGLLIKRHELSNVEKTLTSRVLIVITRRGK